MIDLGALTLQAAMDAFAQPATLQRGTAPPITLRGVFDRHAAVTEQDRDGALVSIRRPRFGLHLADLPAGTTIMQGDVLRVAGATYKVHDVQPDGLGGVALTLTARPLAESSLP